MDSATAQLALQMQLDDVQTILATLPNSSDATEAISERTAFETLRDELSRKWTQLHGQVFASTILREENTNRIVFKKLLDEEQQAERDHDLACRLAGLPVPQRPLISKKAPTGPYPTAINKTTMCKKRPAEDHVGPEQTSDTDRNGGRVKVARVDNVKVKTGTSPVPHMRPSLDTPNTNNGVCSSCLDMHPGTDMLQLPCKDEGDKETHAYCRDCLRRLFESCITDSSHFPPRCCSKIIPLLSCMRFLPQQLISRFEARREELGTPNRTYCSNAGCSKWIPPTSIVAGVATCTTCSQTTCTTCKTKQHEGLCPEDKDVKKLMNVAQQKRWQTCLNCKEMVELERGCYHIICRCRHEFCYLCLAKFVEGRKTCKCRGGDEHFLVDRRGNNAAIAAAAVPVPAPAPAPHPTIPPRPAQPVVSAPTVPAPVHQAPVAAPIAPPSQPVLPEPPAYAAMPPTHFYGQAPYQPFYAATPALAPPHPHWYAHPASPAVPAARSMQQQQQQQQQQRPCDHEFERLYRSEGDNTLCDWCDREDRWVNWCEYCNLHLCWFCTKHRT